jgi:hypothetical protein
VVWAVCSCLLALGTLPTSGPSQPYPKPVGSETCMHVFAALTPTYEHIYCSSSSVRTRIDLRVARRRGRARLALGRVSADAPVTCVRFPVARGHGRAGARHGAHDLSASVCPSVSPPHTSPPSLEEGAGSCFDSYSTSILR